MTGMSESDRGFKSFEPIKGHFANGDMEAGSIRVLESSCAWPPSIALDAYDTQTAPPLRTRAEFKPGNAYLQLTLEAATELRDQLTWLIENHYQVKPRPEPE